MISTFIQKNPFSIHVCHFYCSLVGRLTLPLWGLIPFATSANSFYSLQCYMHHLPLGWPGTWVCARNHEKPFYWKMLIGIWWSNTSHALGIVTILNWHRISFSVQVLQAAIMGGQRVTQKVEHLQKK